MGFKVDVAAWDRLIPFGPAGDLLPAQFSATYTYADLPIHMTLTVRFDGVHRAHVDQLRVNRVDGASLSPHDLVSLRPAQVVSEVVLSAIKPNADPAPDELLATARTYWAHWISWGKPRQAVMDAFGLPRSTANYRIRKARDRYGLPGVHADLRKETD